jgi:hypothetical protein
VPSLADEQHEEIRAEVTQVQGAGSGPSFQLHRLHLHRVSVGLVILVLAAIQLGWLAVLGYGFVKLIT